MAKAFAGVTHAIVRNVHCAEDMRLMNGTMSLVDVCFGPGDNHAIRMIAIKKMIGPTSGLTAHIPRVAMMKEGKRCWVEALEGKVADEAKQLALVAFDRVKTQFGLKFNKQYRVLAKSIEEIGEPTAAV